MLQVSRRQRFAGEPEDELFFGHNVVTPLLGLLGWHCKPGSAEIE